jgi:PadR family transcriptional regulator, regulatory protein AphA
VLFGSFASSGDLAQNLRTSIANHEMRLLEYRQTSQIIPTRGEFRQGHKRHNPYATESEEDPYLGLIARFAIEFEKTYLRWLYEVLDFVENRQVRIPLDSGEIS